MTPAALLDRDGTLVEEVNYLHRVEDVRILPGVPEALRRLRDAGYRIVVVTNQAGVARGYYDEAAVAAVHAHLAERLPIDAFYHCPHHPEFTGPCACRKPAPGLFRRAVAELGLDPARSFAVGDRRSDLAAAAAIGIPGFLVRTGYGAAEAEGSPYPVFEDLAAGVEGWLEQVCPERTPR